MLKRQMKQEKKSYLLSRISYLYLALPFFLFVVGYFKVALAIPCFAVLCISMWFAWKQSPFNLKMEINHQTIILGAAIIAIVFVWVYFSGIGGFTYQNADHSVRNEILELMVERNWPVSLEDGGGYFEKPVLVYYFAFWFPAALFGKCFGLMAGHFFLYFWTVLGLLLVFRHIMEYTKQFKLWPIIIFIFFSGLDLLGKFIVSDTSGFLWIDDSHSEFWVQNMQFSSNTTQLFWVFNQAVPAWLITMLLLNSKDNRSIVFIYSFGILACPMPAIGMIPIIFYFVIQRYRKLCQKSEAFKDSIIVWAKEHFTFQNFFGGGLIGISSFLFLKGNVAGSQVGISDSDSGTKIFVMSYILFVFFEILIYFILLYRKNYRNGLYWVILVSLLLMPFVKIGFAADFTMRASIPALVILCMFVITTFADYLENFQKNKGVCIILALSLAIGSLTAFHEIKRTAMYTVRGYTEIYKDFDFEIVSDKSNFFGEADDSIFFKYIAK